MGALDWRVKEDVCGLLLACLRHAEIHTPDHLSAVLSVSRAPSPGSQNPLLSHCGSWGGGSGRRLRSGGGGRGLSGGGVVLSIGLSDVTPLAPRLAKMSAVSFPGMSA